jgi:hypothetical protein
MDALSRLGGKPDEPVPQVDADDRKTVFEVFQDMANRHPGGSVAVGLGIFQKARKPGADIPSLTYRSMMLQTVVQPAQEQLAPWDESRAPGFRRVPGGRSNSHGVDGRRNPPKQPALRRRRFRPPSPRRGCMNSD